MNRYLTAGILIFGLTSSFLASAACKTNLPFHKADRYIDNNNDGTVIDTLTGLTWMRCPLGRDWNRSTRACDARYEQGVEGPLDVKDSWNAVLVATQSLNASNGYAGFYDWRVPNIKELASMTMLHCYPPVDTNIFPDAGSSTGAKHFWSSTPSRKLYPLNISEDPLNPVYEYHTQAWTYSLGDSTIGKVSEQPTHMQFNIMLVRGR